MVVLEARTRWHILQQDFPSFRTLINTHSNLFPHQTEKEWPASAEQPYSDKTRCDASACFVDTMCGAPKTQNERVETAA